jgi:hypothetical protein
MPAVAVGASARHFVGNFVPQNKNAPYFPARIGMPALRIIVL